MRLNLVRIPYGSFFMDDLTDGAIAQIGQLTALIEKAEKLREIKTHPGKTDEFANWKSELETFIWKSCGEKSPEWKKYSSLNFFPRWYDRKKHGPIPKDLPGVVLTDSQESDRKTALNFYLDSLRESIAIMRGLASYIKTHKMALIAKEESSASGGGPVYNANFSQNQTQEQSQKQQLSVEQAIEITLQKIKENYGEAESEKAEELLGSLKKDKNWSNVQKTASWFLNLGRDAFIALLPTLTKILLNQG